MIFDRLFGGASRAATPAADADFWYTSAGTASLTGVTVSTDTSLAISAVWACVNAISQDVAKIPLIIYRRLANGGRERAPNHPLYELLHSQPNAWQTSYQWRQQMLAHLLLRGNFYNELIAGPRGFADQLRPIHPDLVTLETTATGAWQYRVRERSGSSRIIQPDAMMHMVGLSLDGVHGVSVIQYARETLGLALATEQYAALQFGRAPRPAGVLRHPGRLGETASKNLAQSFERAHTGPQNWQRVAVLEEGMEFQTIGISAKDAQYLESRQFQVPEVARWFRVPLHKIQDLSRSTFCLPRDARVLTVAGPVPIAQVKVGDEVWSRTPDESWHRARVAHAACTGHERILTITTSLRTLRCTANHRVPVQRRVLTPFLGGRGQTTTIDGERYRYQWQTSWIQAGDIKPGDYLLAANGLPDLQSDQGPSRTLTEPFMEVLGMMLGDGFSARGIHGKGSTVGFSHGEQESHVGHYAGAMASELRAYAGPYGRRHPEHTVPATVTERDKNTTVCYSSLAYDELEAIGVLGTARTKRVPAWVFEVGRSYQLALLRGYLDADGTVNRTGHLRFTSVNRELLDDVRHLCMMCGVRAGNLFSTEVQGRFSPTPHTLYGFVCTNARDNFRVGSHATEHQARMHEHQERASARTRVVPVYPYEHKTLPDGVLRSKVLSVSLSAIAEPVFDLDVEGTHTFVADGVVIHNSNIEQQSIEYVTDTLTPWCANLEQVFARDLILYTDTYFAEFLLAGLMRGDAAARATFYNAGVSHGWLTRNEVRALENLNPLPGLDEPLTPMNITGRPRVAADPEPDSDDDEDQARAAAPRLPATPAVVVRPLAASADPVSPRVMAIVTEAAARVVRREIQAATKAAQRHAADAAGWLAWLEAFYAQHGVFVAETLKLSLPVAQAYAAHQAARLRDGGLATAADWEWTVVSELAALALHEAEEAAA